MIKNNNGAILIVTVISMFILTIIGFISLEMFVAQNALVATDVAKVRTFYAADGIVEMMRGYINVTCPDHLTINYVDAAVPASGDWVSGSSAVNAAVASGYDTTPTFPVVFAKVEVRRAPVPPNALYVDFSTTTVVQYYRIMGVSSVTVNSDVIYSTVSYYFYVSSITPDNYFRKRFAAWREHKLIQNDNGTIQ
ncbi:MAG: hypothetical protein PHR82_03925 [Endomicrobiaceae bacterium]|nr:hypothetical protein [Endomicrobiaceae bacterium]